jgi:hypothetical protein
MELSSLTGINIGTLSKFETGKRIPNDQQQHVLVSCLGCSRYELTRACYKVESPEFRGRTRKFYCQPSKPEQPKDRESAVRYWAAMQRYPALLVELENQLKRRDDNEGVAVYLREACFDSALEYVAHAYLLAVGGVPGWACPQRMGFRELPIVDPRTRLCTGGARYPALATERSLFFPQVSLMVDGRKVIRPDLLWLRKEQGVASRVIEFDGRGHDFGEDNLRERALRVPVLRFSESDVVSGRFLERLEVA